MNHVRLDDQPAAVRDFVLALATEPGGSVVEMNGRPVARVLPPALAPETPSADGGWTAEMNLRRCELIDRKYAGDLTADEEDELKRLQAAMHRFIDEVAPLPVEAARQLHQQLLEKAGKPGA